MGWKLVNGCVLGWIHDLGDCSRQKFLQTHQMAMLCPGQLGLLPLKAMDCGDPMGRQKYWTTAHQLPDGFAWAFHPYVKQKEGIKQQETAQWNALRSMCKPEHPLEYLLFPHVPSKSCLTSNTFKKHSLPCLLLKDVPYIFTWLTLLRSPIVKKYA